MSMSRDSAQSSAWRIGEVIFGIPLLIAIALQFILPLSLPRQFTPLLVTGGVALVLAGLRCILLARRELAKHGQPTDPGFPTSKVVTTGIYALSRNPMYLGAAGIIGGAALGLNQPWMLITLIPALVACHYLLIAPEERYLLANFGAEYQDYFESVHRWMGRLRSAHRDEDAFE